MQPFKNDKRPNYITNLGLAFLGVLVVGFCPRLTHLVTGFPNRVTICSIWVFPVQIGKSTTAWWVHDREVFPAGAFPSHWRSRAAKTGAEPRTPGGVWRPGIRSRRDSG